jgi:hypothetical protein
MIVFTPIAMISVPVSVVCADLETLSDGLYLVQDFLSTMQLYFPSRSCQCFVCYQMTHTMFEFAEGSLVDWMHMENMLFSSPNWRWLTMRPCYPSASYFMCCFHMQLGYPFRRLWLCQGNMEQGNWFLTYSIGLEVWSFRRCSMQKFS